MLLCLGVASLAATVNRPKESTGLVSPASSPDNFTASWEWEFTQAFRSPVRQIYDPSTDGLRDGVMSESRDRISPTGKRLRSTPALCTLKRPGKGFEHHEAFESRLPEMRDLVEVGV